MKPQEILLLSAAIARRTKMDELSLGTTVLRRRGTELSLAPRDPRYASIIVELDPKDEQGERVKGVRIRLVRSEALHPWDTLTEQLGPFTRQAELSGRPEVEPTHVATARPAGCLPQTIRLSVDHSGQITGFVVREHSV